MPNDTNTTPTNLEDAIGRMLDANPHMTRGDVVEHISQSIDDPRFASIPGIKEDLHAVRVKSFAGHILSGFSENMHALPSAVVGAVTDALGGPTSAWARQGRSMISPPPDRRDVGPESPGGELIGSLGAFATPMGPSNMLEDVGKATPFIKGLMAATGRGARMVRGAGEGAVLGAAGAFGDQPTQIAGRDVSQTKMGAALGAAGPVVSDVLGAAWEKIAGRFAQAATPETAAGAGPTTMNAPIDLTPGMRDIQRGGSPEIGISQVGFGPGGSRSRVEDMVSNARQGDLAAGLMPEGESEKAPSWLQRAQLMPTDEESVAELRTTETQPSPSIPGPVVAPASEPSRAWFAIPPENRGFNKSAEGRLRETEVEPIGTMQIRAGQPFRIERHNELDTQRSGLKAYAYPTSSLGRAGRPAVVDLEKPMVVDVGSTGEAAFTDAARAMYADNPKVLAALDAAKDQVGLAQELIARRAQKGGYDAVSLSTPDMTENVILGLKDFKAGPHPDLDKATQSSINLKRPAAKAEAAPKKSSFKPKAQEAVQATVDKPKPELNARQQQLLKNYEGRSGGRPLDKIEKAEIARAADPVPPMTIRLYRAGDKGAWTENPEHAASYADEKNPVMTVEVPADKTKPRISPFARPGTHTLTPEQEKSAEIWNGKPQGGPSSVNFNLESLQAAMRSARATEEPARAAGPFAEMSSANESANAGVYDDVSRMHPEVQAAITNLQEAGLNRLAYVRPVASAIDHPKWQQTMMKVVQTEGLLNNLTKRFGDTLKDAFKGVPESEFDEIARAMEGLQYDENFNLRQTALEIRPAHDEIAHKVKALTDEAYVLLTGNDARIPSIMERFGLDHDRKQFVRLRTIQTPGPARDALYTARTPPSHAEEIVAAATRGMLGFDGSHDLDITPWKGFLSFYPVENERAKVADAIKFMQEQKLAGYAPTGMDDLNEKLTKYQKRLDYIDQQVKQSAYRPLPNRDFVPKYRYMAPLKGAKDPAARTLFPDMNVPRVSTKFIAGVLDKRRSDVVLDQVRQLLKDPAFQRADIKQYITDYAQTIRGSRGYRGDAQMAQHLNNAFGKDKFTAQQVHNTTSFIMDFMAKSRLFWSPIRFPIINLTHLFVGLYPVAGEKIFARAVSDVMANPSRWFAEAAEGGAIRQESDFLREIGDPKTVAAKGPLRQAMMSLTYMTENFRRAVAYRAGLITEPSEWSPLVKAFSKEGHANLLEARKAYARGLSLTTQFDSSIINKPLAFTGSPMRRLVSQFKTWPANLASLYTDMAKKGEWASLGRGIPTLWLFGGVSTVTGGPLVYDAVRDHMMRHGHYLPNQTGAEYLADTLGFQGTVLGDVAGMNLFSLHDPFAIIPPSLSGVAGPAIGSVIDAGQQVSEAVSNEDYAKLYGIALGAISPQLRAAVQAGAEYWNDGKVFGPSGHLEMTRPIAASVMRGLDLIPSSRSIRYADMQDIASAMESGNQQLIAQTRDKAKRDGVYMDGRFEAGIRAIVKRRKGPLNRSERALSSSL